MTKSTFEVLATFTDHKGRVHLPPDPPLIKGYPPWFPRPHEYRRKPPLAHCPDGKCRRAQKCLNPLHGEFCQKTHMDAEAFREQLIRTIDDLMYERFGTEWDEMQREGEAERARTGDDCPPLGPEWKAWLTERETELLRQELLAFQQNWVKEQQEKERQMLAARAAKQGRKRGRKETSPASTEHPLQTRGKNARPSGEGGAKHRERSLAPEQRAAPAPSHPLNRPGTRPQITPR